MSIDADQYGNPHATTDASQAAAHLLEITARETEQWRADATKEAAAIVARAREEAEEVLRAAREEASRIRQATSDLRRRHDEEIARLEQVATDQRDLLGRHLTDLLDRVNSIPRPSAQ